MTPVLELGAEGARLVAPGLPPTLLPARWLRERCPDAASLDPVSSQRFYNPSGLPEDLAVTRLVPCGPGLVEIGFSDGHVSRFALADIAAEAAAAPGRDGGIDPEPWDAGLSPQPRFAWPAAPSDRDLLDRTESFLRHGFVILEGVPRQDGAILEVARRFGFPRDTNFGTVFEVRSVPSAEDLAYSSLALAPHTDNPYRTPVPGIQLLHCLVNETSGGLSTLVDGLAVSEALRRDDPEAWDILTRTPVRFRFLSATAEHVAWAPLIELDAAGRFETIRVSPRLEYVPLAEPARLAAFYRARRALDRLLEAPGFTLRFRLADGDLMMFDNRRLLHGRTGFDPAEGHRHLQGCYIDIDGPRSLHRVLKRRLGTSQREVAA